MRAVIQRVSRASVRVESKIVGEIGQGLLVLLGVGRDDTTGDADYLADKTASLRIFPDNEGKMNRSVQDVQGAVLAISQFTLMGDLRRGRRPSFADAARPELAEPLYEQFVGALRARGIAVQTGIFGAMMDVESVNDGPVTILLDSHRLF